MSIQPPTRPIHAEIRGSTLSLTGDETYHTSQLDSGLKNDLVALGKPCANRLLEVINQHPITDYVLEHLTINLNGLRILLENRQNPSAPASSLTLRKCTVHRRIKDEQQLETEIEELHLLDTKLSKTFFTYGLKNTSRFPKKISISERLALPKPASFYTLIGDLQIILRSCTAVTDLTIACSAFKSLSSTNSKREIIRPSFPGIEQLTIDAEIIEDYDFLASFPDLKTLILDLKEIGLHSLETAVKKWEAMDPNKRLHIICRHDDSIPPEVQNQLTQFRQKVRSTIETKLPPLQIPAFNSHQDTTFEVPYWINNKLYPPVPKIPSSPILPLSALGSFPDPLPLSLYSPSFSLTNRLEIDHVLHTTPQGLISTPRFSFSSHLSPISQSQIPKRSHQAAVQTDVIQERKKSKKRKVAPLSENSSSVRPISQTITFYVIPQYYQGNRCFSIQTLGPI